MKANEKNADQDKVEGTEQIQEQKSTELKTDFPMSEKDEVKQAEKNTNKQRGGER